MFACRNARRKKISAISSVAENSSKRMPSEFLHYLPRNLKIGSCLLKGEGSHSCLIVMWCRRPSKRQQIFVSANFYKM